LRKTSDVSNVTTVASNAQDYPTINALPAPVQEYGKIRVKQALHANVNQTILKITRLAADCVILPALAVRVRWKVIVLNALACLICLNRFLLI
jgi:hypothetical protein